MDSHTIKWLCFTGLAEDYPAWSTKFMAYMQRKDLYKSLLDKEVLMPEVTPLTEAATADETAEWAAQVEQRNQQIKEIDEQRIAFGVILR
jgi:hypothetical protein